MPEMPRYTIRLPLALAAQVEAHIAAGTPFPVLIREALGAYLGRAAGSADDPLTILAAQLAALTVRVETLERQTAPASAPTDAPPGRVEPLGGQAAPTDAPTPKRVLGKLCPRGHDHEGTGQSLRRLPGRGCLACEAEQAQRRRADRRR